MNPYFVIILSGVCSVAAGIPVHIWIYRWNRRESLPKELRDEITQLGKDLVAVREQIKYIEGRLNGKNCMREA